jgi:hypothetical protein
MKAKHKIADQLCKIGFRFKPSHEEKRYLVNTCGRKYSTLWSADPDLAGRVHISKKEVGIAWIRKRLAKSNFGKGDGYAFCAFVGYCDGSVTTVIFD